MSDRFRPVPLHHQDGDGARGLAWAAAKTADRIADRQADGSVAILGYSYGAILAYEAAQILLRRGRTIAFLAIVDPALSDTEFGVFESGPARSVVSDDTPSRLAMFMLRRRPVWALVSAIPHRILRRRVRNKLHAYARRWARRMWRPEPLTIPGLIVTSSQLRHETESRLRQLCPAMRCLTIDQRHLELMAGASGRLIVEAILTLGDDRVRV